MKEVKLKKKTTKAVIYGMRQCISALVQVTCLEQETDSYPERHTDRRVSSANSAFSIV